MNDKNVILVLLFTACIVQISMATGTSEDNHQEKTLIAVYMVGSDLESTYGAATRDIAEMIEGWEPEPAHSVNLLVGYGGSEQDGWRGLTISTITDLAADYEDGIIGNEAFYWFRDISCNMGDQKTLELFLVQISQQGTYDRCLFFFWDHGTSYYGIGFDENHQMDRLTLREVRNGLLSSEIPLDLIGMDACLMGSLEVAHALRGTGTYLLASEETVSGYGFDYKTIISLLKNDPEVSARDLGIAIIDAYIADPGTGNWKKTLSLIDLRRIEEVVLTLSTFSDSLNDYLDTGTVTFETIGRPLYQAERFGYYPEGDRETAIDLADFTRAVILKPNTKTAGQQELLSAIKTCIVYSKEDGSRPGSTGISIFSPRNARADDLSRIQKMISMNSSWDVFVQKYIDYVNSDTTPPVIETIPDGYYSITDATGIARVMVTFALVPPGGDYTYTYLISAEPVSPDANGMYHPAPLMEVFSLKDSATNNTALLKTTFNRFDTENRAIYSSIITVTRNGTETDLILEIIYDPPTGTARYQLTPYTMDQKTGEFIFYRVPFSFTYGDIITTKISKALYPLYPKADQATLEIVDYEDIVVTSPVEVIKGPLPPGIYFCTLQAFDYTLNGVSINLGKLRPPNRSVIEI